MLRKGGSQEELIAFSKQPIESPLDFQEVAFDQSEWDNIPTIITKSNINLNKYMTSTLSLIAKQ